MGNYYENESRSPKQEAVQSHPISLHGILKLIKHPGFYLPSFVILLVGCFVYLFWQSDPMNHPDTAKRITNVLANACNDNNDKNQKIMDIETIPFNNPSVFRVTCGDYDSDNKAWENISQKDFVVDLDK